MRKHFQSNLLTKYMRLYARKPDGRVFAPLAESYRKLGLLDDAFSVLLNGIKNHPDYLLGHIVLANCYFDQKNYSKTISILSPFIDREIDNFRLQKLYGLACYYEGQGSEALRSLKTVLFLNPKDREVAKLVIQLEKSFQSVTQASPNNSSRNSDPISVSSSDQNFQQYSDKSSSSFDQWNEVNFKESHEMDKPLSESELDLLSIHEDWEMKPAAEKLRTLEDVDQVEKLDQEPELSSELKLGSESSFGKDEIEQDVFKEDDLTSSWDPHAVNESSESLIDTLMAETFTENEFGAGESGVEDSGEGDSSIKDLESDHSARDIIDHRLETTDSIESVGNQILNDKERSEFEHLQDSEDIPLVTHTLVDIYISQKHFLKAIEVLRRIVRADPKDSVSKAKLEKLEKSHGQKIEVSDRSDNLDPTNRSKENLEDSRSIQAQSIQGPNNFDNQSFTQREMSKPEQKMRAFLKAINDKAEQAKKNIHP